VNFVISVLIHFIHYHLSLSFIQAIQSCWRFLLQAFIYFNQLLDLSS